VPTGSVGVNIPLPDFWTNLNIEFVPFIDFQIRLQFKWFDQEAWSSPSAFNAALAFSPVRPREIRGGYRTQRRLACPKCKGPNAAWMNVEGFRSEEEFIQKKEVFMRELEASCPQHYSQYALRLSDDPMGAYPGS
jgi:hypothetical protein